MGHEFRRLSNERFTEADDYSDKAMALRDCSKLVRYLGQMTLRRPGVRTTQADLVEYLGLHTKRDKRGRKLTKSACLNQISDLTTQARKELKGIYLLPESKLSAFRICLPKGNKTRGVCAIFKEDRHTRRNTSPPLTSQSGEKEALTLWQRIMSGTEEGEVFLVFDTPQLGLPDTMADAEGLWSGSGEVFAAYMLGQNLSRLNRTINLRRWRDLNFTELTGEFNWLIILGGSLNNPGLKLLRRRDLLVPQQTFHFENATSELSRGRICKGPLFHKEVDAYVHREAVGGEPEIEYALISVYLDAGYQQKICSMAGITTTGTHAAASFLCNDSRVRELIEFVAERCGHNLETRLCSFEAVLQMQVNDRLPVDVTVVDAIVYDA